MNINWRVRVRNKSFWIALIPAILLLVQAIVKLFGFELDFSSLSENLLAIVNAIFTVLVILGVVNDPTTDGMTDSKQAMTYDVPKKD